MDMMLNACKIKIIIPFLLVALVVSSQTLWADENGEYAGTYSSDLIWSGTVTMLSDVLILKGASLTIQAGTRIRVIPAAGTKIDPEYLSSQTELLIRGQLDIQGTAEKPVRFVVSPVDDSEDYAWAGITLDRAGDSRIAFAELDRADIAIRCVGSSPEILANKISASRYGIVLQQQSHPEIINNTLQDGEGGVFCWRGSNPYLQGNKISGHDEEAVFVDADSRPSLDRNTISGNEIGLAIYRDDQHYDPTEIIGNRENVRLLGNQGQGGQ